MQKTILMIVAVALVGCASTPEVVSNSPEAKAAAEAKVVPNSPEAAAAIESAIRKAAGKLEGELTKVDLEKVTFLRLDRNRLTDVKGLEKLTQLTELSLKGNRLTSVKGLEKLTQLETLRLYNNKLTDVKGLEKLTLLEKLYLQNNPDLTKAQIAELQKALPKCKIESNPTN